MARFPAMDEPRHSPVPAFVRAGFALDLDRCTGCSACSIACRIENNLPHGLSFRQVTTFNPTHQPGIPVFHLSLACNHCEDPVCLPACPTGAYSKNLVTGAVLLDENRCMGCTYCSWVCPYEAPQFDVARGVMTKCTFCTSRVEAGQLPACVVACPVDALNVLGQEGQALGHSTVPGFPDTGLRPQIQFFSSRRVPSWRRIEGSRTNTIEWRRLRKEWPLALFTGITASLVGWFLAGSLGTTPPRPFPFLGLATAAILISTLHLGRPSRMWRALRNVRTSWISREIALFTAFVGCAAVSTLVSSPTPVLSWIAAALGLATLGAMDLVYRVRGQALRAVPHSAMSLTTGLLLAGCLSGNPWLAGVAATVKLGLYVERHLRHIALAPWERALPPARLLLGFLVPAVAWLVHGTPLPLAAICALLLGEAMDRFEFYATLEFLGPRRQAALDEAASPRL